MYLSQRWSSKSLGPGTIVPIQTKTQGGFDCVP